MAWTDEQLKAIEEFGQNILVSAGAGSGKTAVLTTRITKHLAKMNIDELLVLTFTEAAAAEMKERVRNKIIEEELFDQLDLLDQAYITTFDSFNLSVVKKYHYLVNVKRNISIADSSMMILYKENLLNELFEELYKNKNPKFIDFMNKFTFKNDRVIKEIILNINSSLDLKYLKRDYLNSYIENNMNEQSRINLISEYTILLNKELKSIHHLTSELMGYGYDKMNKDLSELLTFSSERQSYDDIKIFFSSFKFPRMASKPDEDAKAINESLKGKAKTLISKLIYLDESELNNSLIETISYNEVLIDILLKFDNKINKFKFERDLYEFNDIAKLALRLVKDFDLVKKDMKSKFKEILVDEYQDTSDLQEEFITAISNNNIYCVGDIKQSIYRFRNANPKNFESKFLSYGKNEGGTRIDLLKNFRSRVQVLDDINLLFEDLMTQEYGAAKYRDGHFMVAGNGNYDSSSSKFYNMEFLTYTKEDYSNDEYEAFIIANKINEYVSNNVQVLGKDNKLRNCDYNDFAILIDRGSSFDLFRSVLSHLQIPVTVFKEEILTSSVILKVISNFLNLVVSYEKSNEYKFSYASISRSFITDNDDNDLLKDIINDCNDTFISNTILDIKYKINSISPLAIYYELIEKFNIYERIIKLDNIKNSLYHLEYLHDIIDNLSSSGYDIHMINTYFKDILSNDYALKVSGATSNIGVKIMTIHKSKGLEFPFIFLPGLHKKFNTFELNDLISYNEKYGIVTPYFNDGMKTNFVKNLVIDNYKKEDISEKIRLFYVALTRAREKMFFVCESFENDKEVDISLMNNFKQFIYFNIDKIYNRITNVSLDNISKDYIVQRSKDYKTYIKKKNILINDLESNAKLINKHKISKELDKVLDENLRRNIALGLRMHAILETIDLNNPDYSEFNLNKLEEDTIKGILNLDLFKNNKDGKFYQELEFIYEHNNESFHGIIDLLLITNDKVYIIDYKLKNTNHNEYIDQLNQYKQYVQTITDKPIELYLLSILDKELKEVK
ncbi:MAG: UvrD-helicase domain-containing protein [bacterium]